MKKWGAEKHLARKLWSFDNYNLPVGEDLLKLVLHGLSGLLVGKLIFADDALELSGGAREFSGNLESGWENVIVVDNLDEGLDLGSSGNLLFGHTLGNFQWALLDTGNQSV